MLMITCKNVKQTKRQKNCSGTNTNLHEIEFNCIRYKLQENAVEFNQRKSHIKHQEKVVSSVN